VDNKTTPLVGRNQKCKLYFTYIVCVMIATIIAHTTIFFIRGPSVKPCLATERKQWEHELVEQKLKEQSRILAWEDEWVARRVQEWK
jgi:hypothetical protein